MAGPRWKLETEIACFCSSNAVKTYDITYEKGGTRRFPSNNQRVGRGMGDSWPSEGGS
jgi:hypothetical protein